MDEKPEPQAPAPSTKVKIAASAGGMIAGAGAAIASLTHHSETRTGAKRLGRRVGKAIAERLGAKPRTQ